MPSIKRNAKATEVKTGFETYDGPMPPRGMYRARIQKLSYKEFKTGTTGLSAVLSFEAAKGDPKDHSKFDGFTAFGRVFFTDSEQAQARESNFYAALGLKDNPTIVTEDGDATEGQGVKVTKIGGKNPIGVYVNVDLRPSRESGHEGEMEVDGMYVVKDRPVAGKAAPVAEPDADEDEDLMEDDDTAEEEEADTEEDDAEVVAREEELNKLSLPALRKEAAALELEVKGLKKAEIVSAILDAEFPLDDEDADEDEESDEEDDVEETEDEEEEDEDDEKAERETELKALDRSGLKKALKAVQPEFRILTKHSEDDLIAAILDAEFGDETPF